MPARRVEVAVHTAHETSPTSVTNENVIYIGRYHPEQLELASICSHEEVKGGM